MKAATQPQLAYSSIEDGAIQSVEDGSLKAIIGKQYDGTQAITIVNGPIPPEPTAPTGTAGIEGATFRWDGTFVDGAIVPMDFSRVELHVSTDPGLTGLLAGTLRATFETPRGGEVWIGLAPVDQYARLVTRTLTGQASAASDVFTITPIALLDSVPTGSDGDAPALSPTPVVTGGIGSLFVSWSPVVNADPVTYEVHVSDTAAFTPDSTTLAGETAGTLLAIRDLPVDDTPLAYDTTYYVQIIAKDVDGAAAPGAEATGSPKQVDVQDLAVGSVTADHLTSNSVTAEKFESVLALLTTILLGANIRLDATDGIVVDSPDGQTKLAADGTGNTFAGQGTFDALTVLKDLGIYGATNFLSGLLSLNTGVTDPLAMPVITSGYDYTATVGSRLNPRGLTDDGGNLWVITDNVAGATSSYQFYAKTDGAGWGAIGLPSGYEAWGGIVKLGGYYYILATTGAGGIGTQYRILKFDASSQAYQFASGVVLVGSASRPAIGTDGTNLLMAYLGSGGNQLNVRTLDQNFAAGAAPTILFSRAAAAGLWGSTDITAINGVVLDGSMRYIASSVNVHLAYDLTSSTVITRNSAYEWPAAAAGSTYGVYGVHHDGTTFHMSTKGRFYDYSNLSGSWKFAYSWYDSDVGGSGTAETKVSTQRVITPTKYAKWTVRIPNSPPDDGTTDGANTARIYAAPNDGSDLVLQTTLAEGDLTETYGTLSLSGTAPQASNQFATRPGAIGNIASVTSDAIDQHITLKGDGTGRAGPLQWGVNVAGYAENLEIAQESSVGGTYSPTVAVSNAMPAGVADLVFVAPASGRVMLNMSMFALSKSDGGSTTWFPQVRTGGTLRAGTVIYGDLHKDGAANYNIRYVKTWTTSYVTGLTPGATYNVYPVCTTTSATGATWTAGVVKITPML